MWRRCVLWRHNIRGCTHPWRISIVPHGHVCSRVSLHRVLTILLGVPFDHNSSSVQVPWEIDFDQPSFWSSNPLEIPAVKTGQTPNDQEAILPKRLGTVN